MPSCTIDLNRGPPQAPDTGCTLFLPTHGRVYGRRSPDTLAPPANRRLSSGPAYSPSLPPPDHLAYIGVPGAKAAGARLLAELLREKDTVILRLRAGAADGTGEGD